MAEKTVFMNFFLELVWIVVIVCFCMSSKPVHWLVPLKMASLLFCPWTKLLVLPGWRKSLKMLITVVAFVFFMVRSKTCFKGNFMMMMMMINIIMLMISWFDAWIYWKVLTTWYISILWGRIFGVHSAFKKQMDRILLLVNFQLLHAWFLGIFLGTSASFFFVWCTKPVPSFYRRTFQRIHHSSIFRRFRKGYPPWN